MKKKWPKKIKNNNKENSKALKLLRERVREWDTYISGKWPIPNTSSSNLFIVYYIIIAIILFN